MEDHNSGGHASDSTCDDSNSLGTSEDGTLPFVVAWASFGAGSLRSCHRGLDSKWCLNIDLQSFVASHCLVTISFWSHCYSHRHY